MSHVYDCPEKGERETETVFRIIISQSHQTNGKYSNEEPKQKHLLAQVGTECME